MTARSSAPMARPRSLEPVRESRACRRSSCPASLPPPEGGRESAVLVLFGEGDRRPRPAAHPARRPRSRATPASRPSRAARSTDDDADVVAAALREAQEETGLDPSGVEVFATLPALWLPPSGFVVTPVLGWWRAPVAGRRRRPRRGRVASCECPLAELLDPANRCSVRHPSRASSVPASPYAACSCGGSPPGCCRGCSRSRAGSAPGTTRSSCATWTSGERSSTIVLLVPRGGGGARRLAPGPRRRRAVVRRLHRRARSRCAALAPLVLSALLSPDRSLRRSAIAHGLVAAGIGNALAGLLGAPDPRPRSRGGRPGSSTRSGGRCSASCRLALVAWVVASALLIVAPLGVVSSAVRGSRVLGEIDAVMPQAPA